MSEKFFVGDRVVFIEEGELFSGTVESVYNEFSDPLAVVKCDNGETYKILISWLAPEPPQAVTESQDATDNLTILLACLAVVDKIVSSICPSEVVPFDESDNEY